MAACWWAGSSRQKKRLRLLNGAGVLAVFGLLVGLVMVISSIQLVS
ncbi:MAG: hypothetical protein U0694_11260 [Anaerolineae bacterium]